MTGKSSKSNPCDVIDLCAPPEVCANLEENKREHLIKHSAEDGSNFFSKTVKRDRDLFAAILCIVVVTHIPYLKFILYPFLIFSTWVHEMCHGMAAVLVNGGINKLMVYKDGSGLCYTWTTGEDWKRAFVASGGYTGTAVIGMLLLLFRRTLRGPTVGLIGMGLAMLLSVALYVRNTFGVVSLLLMGATTVLCGWKLPAEAVLFLYCFLAATCSFNALDSINDLLDIQPGEAYVNGQQTSTDAHTVADLIGMTYGFWALCWLFFALVCSAIGIFFPWSGVTYNRNQKEVRKAQQSSLPQHGSNLAVVGNGYARHDPPNLPSSPVNPAYENRMQQQTNAPAQQQYPWQTTQAQAEIPVAQAEIPIAQATIY